MDLRTWTLLLCAAPVTVMAQEHPIIASYTLTEFDGGIRIDWTTQGGSTCNGQDVERSTDGVSFTAVHRIDGICGNTSQPVPYDWIDNAPPEFSTVYYRVKLGLDGYTSVRSIVFDQLTTSDQRFFPSPMNGEATLVLNVRGNAAVDLFIWDSAGRLAVQSTALNGPIIPINLSGSASGVYTYRAISDRRVFEGRFVRE